MGNIWQNIIAADEKQHFAPIQWLSPGWLWDGYPRAGSQSNIPSVH